MPARTNKKRQRKIDVAEVEAQLDQVRTEERLVGTGGIGKLADGNLFAIDSTGSEQARKRARFLKIDEVCVGLTRRLSNRHLMFPGSSPELIRLPLRSRPSCEKVARKTRSQSRLGIK